MKSAKKQIGVRLDIELVECLEDISREFPRLSLTDIVDMGLKNFLVSVRIAKDAREILDLMVGQYLRGEYEQEIRGYYQSRVKSKKP